MSKTEYSKSGDGRLLVKEEQPPVETAYTIDQLDDLLADLDAKVIAEQFKLDELNAKKIKVEAWLSEALKLGLKEE